MKPLQPYDPDAAALQAASEQFDEMELVPFDYDAPRGLAGVGESLKSLALPSAQGGRLALFVGAPFAGARDAYMNDAAAGFADLRRRQGERDVPIPERRTDSQDWYFENVYEALGQRAVDHWTPDVNAMGNTAKVLSTVNEVVGSIPTMAGLPGLFLTNAAISPAVDLTRQGVDTKTAVAVGGVNFAVNAVGMKVPAAWGNTLTQRLATGAGSNVALGAGADATSSTILEQRGYTQEAEGYDAADPYARGLDFLMGAAFGAKAHADAPRLTPEQRDAVLVANSADHIRRATLPGQPVAAGADVRHETAFRTALDQLSAGQPITVAQLLRPGDFDLRADIAGVPQSATNSPASSTSPGGQAYAEFRRALESGGRADARPVDPKTGRLLSQAFGIDQFTPATWRKVVAAAKPAWAQGMSDAELLAARGDPAKSGEMVAALDRQHAAALEAAALPVDRHTLYAAHHFGINKAKAFARAAADTPMELIVTRAQLEANPYLRGKTKADTIANWDSRARKAGVALDSPTPRESSRVAREDSPDAIAPRPTWAAGEAAAVIDTRLSNLDELSASNRLSDADLTALRREDAQIVDTLRTFDRRQRQGIIPANPRDRLSQEQVQTLSARRAEIRQGIEAHRAAVGYENQAAQLRQRLDKIDRDADLIRLAEKLQQPAVAAQHPARLNSDAPRRSELPSDQPTERPDGSAAPARSDVAELIPGVRARREADGFRIELDDAVLSRVDPVRAADLTGRVLGRDDAARAVLDLARESGVPLPEHSAAPRAPASTVEAARELAAQQPDLLIPTGAVDAEGRPITIRVADALAEAEAGAASARIEIDAVNAAANCFLRSGA